MAFEEQMAAVNAAAFATLADVTVSLDGMRVVGMFEAPGRSTDLGVAALTVEDPVLVVRDCDVPSDVVGTTVVLADGREFTVRDRIPDGLGATRLLLSAAA